MTQVLSRPVLWRATPGPQEVFLSRPEFEVLYGGAAGGGKTDGLLVGGLRFVGNEFYKAIFLRRTFPELQEAMDRAHFIFPKIASGAHWQGDKKRWVFPSGAIYRFGHMQGKDDWRQYETDEYQYIAFDQLTSFTETQYVAMFSRARSSKGIPCYVRGATNPGGLGHGWVKRRFIDNATPGVPRTFTYTLLDGSTVSLKRIFIPARVRDNPYLMRDQGYLARLAALPEHLRKAYLDGDWAIMEGQYFDAWRDYHVVSPFPIPASWRRYRSIDWGYTQPFACLWWAVSPERHRYCYRELYERHLDDSEQAKEVLRLSHGEQIYETYADPSCWGEGRGKNKWGVTIAQAWQKEGLDALKADNRRISGWQRCRGGLKLAADGKPWTMFFSSCVNAVRTIPEQVIDSNNPEDLDTDGEDHAADAWRYFEMSQPEPAVIEEKKKETWDYGVPKKKGRSWMAR